MHCSTLKCTCSEDSTGAFFGSQKHKTDLSRSKKAGKYSTPTTGAKNRNNHKNIPFPRIFYWSSGGVHIHGFLKKERRESKKKTKEQKKHKGQERNCVFFFSKTEGRKWREETMFFYDVTGTPRPRVHRIKKRYLFLSGKGMFLCFWAQKKAPVETR